MTKEAELIAALQEAWAELERKQGYMQDAINAANRLQEELDNVKQTAAVEVESVAAARAGPLQTALNEAWAELEKKQQFLENSFEEIRLRDEEIASLRQQLAARPNAAASSQGFLPADIDAAMQKAWNDLEDREIQIAVLSAQLEAYAAHQD